MPYLDPQRRAQLAPLVDHILDTGLRTPGDLNYLFTLIAKVYLQNKGNRYQYHNDVLGALIGALLEFYRRDTAPYEDQKIEQNGDVTVDKL